MIEAERCRLCGEPTVGLFEMDQGCVCYPDDRMQALCLQHAYESEPLGSFAQVAEWVI